MKYTCSVCFDELKYRDDGAYVFIDPCPTCRAEQIEREAELRVTIEDLKDQVFDLKERIDLMREGI